MIRDIEIKLVSQSNLDFVEKDVASCVIRPTKLLSFAFDNRKTKRQNLAFRWNWDEPNSISVYQLSWEAKPTNLRLKFDNFVRKCKQQIFAQNFDKIQCFSYQTYNYVE